MRKVFAACLAFAPFVVGGCLAYGSEKAAPAGVVPVGLTWESLVIVYGPMAGMLVWFIWREEKRDKREVERRKAAEEQTAKQVEAITKFEATLSEFRADIQKNRTAVYQLRDEARGKTRVIEKEE